MTLRIRVVTAEPRTAIGACGWAMMHHAITCFGRNQRASSLQVPGLTAAFTCGFRLYAAHGKSPGARHLTFLNRYRIEFDEQDVWD